MYFNRRYDEKQVRALSNTINLRRKNGTPTHAMYSTEECILQRVIRNQLLTGGDRKKVFF